VIRVARYTFLAVAMLFLGVYVASYFEREFYQAYDGWKFDHPITPPQPVQTTPGRPVTPVPPPRDQTIGRISVPRLHLSAMVREGIDDITLERAVGHIPTTALPGHPGNVGVAGHRDTFFRGLKDLHKNDEIQFATSNGNYKYRIEEMMIVQPENGKILAPRSSNTLTIVTCYPFNYIGSAPKRFVVRARQVQ